MFQEVTAQFVALLSEHQRCFAGLYVDGLATQVAVTYLPNNEMEIRGLPNDLPRYLRFDDHKVYKSPDGQSVVEDTEEAAFYQLYRTWDPRVIARAEPTEDDDLEERPSNHVKARYYLDKAVSLPPAIRQRVIADEDGWREVEIFVENGRLRELSEWDFSRNPTQLTIVFAYIDELVVLPQGLRIGG